MGDPLWLPEVLRAEGLTVREHGPHGSCPGWRGIGHGDMPGKQWGVMMHHTGDEPPYDAGPNVIAHHPSLGLCSQCHLGRDGVWTICGAGIAWHAGNGSWPGVPNQDANSYLIGVEAENNGTEGWSRVQYDSYIRGVGAILRHLGHDSSHAIGHKEWAGAAQGKWDPGGMDMNKARADIQRVIDSKPGEASGNPAGGSTVWGESFKNFKGASVTYGFAFSFIDKLTNWIYEQFMGVDGKGWSILGKSKIDDKRNNTLVEAVAEIRQDVKNLTELVKRGPGA